MAPFDFHIPPSGVSQYERLPCVVPRTTEYIFIRRAVWPQSPLRHLFDLSPLSEQGPGEGDHVVL